MKHEITDRGFKHMQPIICTYGSAVRVYESGAASEPCIWLNVRVDPTKLTNQPSGEGTAHLTLEQAQTLRKQLAYLIKHHYQVEDEGEQ